MQRSLLLMFLFVALEGTGWAQAQSNCVTPQERTESDRKIDGMTSQIDVRQVSQNMTEAMDAHSKALDAYAKCQSGALAAMGVGCGGEVAQVNAAAMKYNAAAGLLDAYKTLLQAQGNARSMQKPVCK